MCNVQPEWPGDKPGNRSGIDGAFRGARRKERNEREKCKSDQKSEEKRNKLKKTRASRGRILAWVSLGGRRVCLVESTADL
jgi:hypothetical protein